MFNIQDPLAKAWACVSWKRSDASWSRNTKHSVGLVIKHDWCMFVWKFGTGWEHVCVVLLTVLCGWGSQVVRMTVWWIVFVPSYWKSKLETQVSVEMNHNLTKGLESDSAKYPTLPSIPISPCAVLPRRSRSTKKDVGSGNISHHHCTRLESSTTSPGDVTRVCFALALLCS